MAQGQEQHFSLLGGFRKGGRWVADRDILLVSLLGGADLDFSDAEVPAGGITVTRYGVIGGVQVVVPPHVNVEVGGFSLIGGRDIQRTEVPPTGAPTVRINSYSLIGGVTVRNR